VKGISLLAAEDRPHGWAILYYGTGGALIASTGNGADVAALTERLLLGRTPQVAVVKIEFYAVAWGGYAS